MEREIPATQIGRWNTIKHPQTGEWVKTERVTLVTGGVRSTRPGVSHERVTVGVTLENGEQLSFAGDEKIIRKE